MYDINGNELKTAYNLSGNIVYTKSPDPYLENRLLIFEDDFSGNSVNPDNWIHEVGHPRGKSYQCKRPGNVIVHGGRLEIAVKKENHLNYTWSAGGIVSRCKHCWALGRFEAKMKFAEAFDSAFWFMGTSISEQYTNDDGTIDYKLQNKGLEDLKSWPQGGEIDVIESWNYTQKSNPQCNLWGNSSSTSLGAGTYPTSIDTVNEWHVYAMEKTSDYIAMFLDGIEYKRWTFTDFNRNEVEAYIDKPIFMILGIGIGDDNDIERVPNGSSMFVDWVRVYAPVGITKPVIETSVQVQENYRMRRGWKSYIPVNIQPPSTSDMTVKWVSEDESIVRCGDDGYVYAENLGEVDIHVITKYGLRATCHITVVPPEDIPVG